jgi:hypothetical protein
VGVDERSEIFILQQLVQGLFERLKISHLGVIPSFFIKEKSK